MIIKNGKIFLDEPGSFETLDIRVEDGKIVEIGENLHGEDILLLRVL